MGSSRVRSLFKLRTLEPYAWHFVCTANNCSRIRGLWSAQNGTELLTESISLISSPRIKSISIRTKFCKTLSTSMKKANSTITVQTIPHIPRWASMDNNFPIMDIHFREKRWGSNMNLFCGTTLSRQWKIGGISRARPCLGRGMGLRWRLFIEWLVLHNMFQLGITVWTSKVCSE